MSDYALYSSCLTQLMILSKPSLRSILGYHPRNFFASEGSTKLSLMLRSVEL